jgi:hypothetical protein
MSKNAMPKMQELCRDSFNGSDSLTMQQSSTRGLVWGAHQKEHRGGTAA